jgi:hypothetical protein
LILAVLATLFAGTAAVPAQAAGAAVTPAAGQYVPLVPARVATKPIAIGGTYTFSPLGLGGIPATGVSAVAFQLHALGSTAAGVGWLQVYPSGATQPATSTVNWAGQVTADNAVVTGLGTDGKITIYNGGATAAVTASVDVTGYYTAAGATAAGSTFAPLQPTRIVSAQPNGAGATFTKSVLGQGGVAGSGVTAVVAFVSTQAGTAGQLVAYPSDVNRPTTAADLNYGTDGRYTAEITVKLSADGSFTLWTSTATTVWVEVAGYFESSAGGSVFTPVVPSRVVNHAAVAAGVTGTFALAGTGGVPSAGVSAVVFNLTGTATAGDVPATDPAAAGALSVNAADQPPPVARQLSYHLGSHWPVQQVSALSATGTIAIHNTAGSGSVTLLADVSGYYTQAPVLLRPSGLPWNSGVAPEGDAATRLDRVTDFTDFRGLKTDNVVIFPSRESWANLEGDWNYADVLPDYPAPTPDPDLVVTVPLWPMDGDVDHAGTADDWGKLAEIIAAKDPNAYIRLGWEMNLDGSYWALRYDPTATPPVDNRAQWQTDFVNAVNWMRAKAPGLRFVWNPNKGGDQTCDNACSRTVFQAVKGLVDVYGIDSYDSYDPDTGTTGTNQHVNQYLGDSLKYAVANGKKFAVPEWGISCNVSVDPDPKKPCQWAGHGGGDNPQYINDYVGFFAAHAGDVAFESYFDEPGTYLQSSLEVTPLGPKAPAAYQADLQANLP